MPIILLREVAAEPFNWNGFAAVFGDLHPDALRRPTGRAFGQLINSVFPSPPIDLPIFSGEPVGALPDDKEEAILGEVQ